MGFYIRKSIGFGPFRFNLSKSGIGISVGVKGARLSFGPKGSFVHVGRYGIYYRQRISNPSTKSRSAEDRQRSVPSYEGRFDDPYTIRSADASELVESSHEAILRDINERVQQTQFAPIIFVLLLGMCLLTYLFLSRNQFSSTFINIATCLYFLFGIPLIWFVRSGDNRKRTTPLYYEIDEKLQIVSKLTRAIPDAFASIGAAWQVTSRQDTVDWKRNAGASYLVDRHKVKVTTTQPPFISTNLNVAGISTRNETLYFFPDCIFVFSKNRYGAVSYKSLNTYSSHTVFIESDGLPRDAEIVGYTWRYVRKRGGPDRRFSNNYQIPQALYGVLELASDTGMNLHFLLSNRNVASRIGDALNDLKSFYHSRASSEEKTSRIDEVRHESKTKGKTPYEILELNEGATSGEISAAYRRMAKRYHPDRVADLAPEIRELAEKRMKTINLAYQMLRDKRTSELIDFDKDEHIEEAVICSNCSTIYDSEVCPFCAGKSEESTVQDDDLSFNYVPRQDISSNIRYLIVGLSVLIAGGIWITLHKNVEWWQVQQRSSLLEETTAETASPDSISGPHVDPIGDLVGSYFKAIENKDIDDVVAYYSSQKRDKLNLNNIRQNANLTEKYTIDKIDTQIDGDEAYSSVFLWQKKYQIPEEYWHVKVSLRMEKGEWKIWSISGERQQSSD